jgi:hypothetical protein
MIFSEEEIFNLQRLLLHKEHDNALLGLSLLKSSKNARLPEGILVAVNMLHSFSPMAEVRDGAEEILTSQAVFSTRRRPLLLKDLAAELQIFVIAQRSPQLGYKRAYKRFEQYRHLYEPLFLEYKHWHRWYRELLKLFYIRGDVRLVISYCDALLQVIPNDFVINNYRFQSVNYLLEHGEGQEELHNQEQWLLHWQTLYPNTDCMIYTLLGQLYSHFYQDKNKASYYYELALAYQGKSQWDHYTAMSANNLASIIIEQNGDLKKAFSLAIQANQWQGQNSSYRETLAYLEWKVGGDTAKAEANFLLALEIDRDNLAAAANLALLYLEAENSKKAVRYIKLILSKKAEPKYLPYIQKAITAYLPFAAPLLEDMINQYLKTAQFLAN